jgi:hypothetical protein
MKERNPGGGEENPKPVCGDPMSAFFRVRGSAE